MKKTVQSPYLVWYYGMSIQGYILALDTGLSHLGILEHV